ncbi:hypothetical protein V7114_18325 [Neobacillus niacini]|uniref:hypothetical protein n=1 Tax=Neobacillus niacini TaxID=86668 RepID=UPI0030000EB0
MGSNIDDLMYSIILKRAYDKYSKKYSDVNNQLIMNLQNQLKESFLVGYSEGHQNGFQDGIVEAKLNTLVKLAVHTDLADQVILKVLEKEGEVNYIDALNQIRKKQNEQA